jgi:hypothetical protein
VSHPSGPHPAESSPHVRVAFVVLMATSVVFRDGFLFVALAAGAMVVIASLVLLLVYPKQPERDDAQNRLP